MKLFYELFWHIPIFIDAIIKNKEVPIHGDGSQTRSMAYISDIVDGTVKAMDSQKAIGEVINILSILSITSPDASSNVSPKYISIS